MGTKAIRYFIPLFISGYFLISIITNCYSEIFPFSAFKLYSVIPNKMEEYDILLNQGENNSVFLLAGNDSLSDTERKYFRYILKELGQNHTNNPIVFPESIQRKVKNYPNAWFVKLTGDYMAAACENKIHTELISKIK